ncbi:MAG: hypothetical protein JXX29_22875 [Deltaproteobacteria bacterium]|nr:hypothetical protein [Deltaproteobacteria bacterium]MBN2674543.1 hypothetical protein [Deltaproteobacteria bacterium]
MFFRGFVSVVLMVVSIFLLASCDDGGADRTSIEELILADDDGFYAQVSIDEFSNVGSLGFSIRDADVSDKAIEAFGEYLADGTIDIKITNSETSVTYSVSDGTYVEGTPAVPGDYTYTVTSEILFVDFYNEYNGAQIQPTNSYFATITVLENKYFESGEYIVQINLL